MARLLAAGQDRGADSQAKRVGSSGGWAAGAGGSLGGSSGGWAGQRCEQVGSAAVLAKMGAGSVKSSAVGSSASGSAVGSFGGVGRRLCRPGVGSFGGQVGAGVGSFGGPSGGPSGGQVGAAGGQAAGLPQAKRSPTARPTPRPTARAWLAACNDYSSHWTPYSLWATAARSSQARSAASRNRSGIAFICQDRQASRSYRLTQRLSAGLAVSLGGLGGGAGQRGRGRPARARGALGLLRLGGRSEPSGGAGPAQPTPAQPTLLTPRKL